MAISLNKSVALYENALRFRAQRTEMLATNIANADTPGYKARDIDFHGAMKQAMGGQSTGGVSMKQTHSGHMSLSGAAGNIDDFVRYRTPFQPALDGNTVESHVEQAAFARNALEYQASLKFFSGRISGMVKAFKEGGN